MMSNRGRSFTSTKVSTSKSIIFLIYRIRRAEGTLIERQDLVRKLQAEISELKKQSN
jgi:hypothetical protein